MTLDQVGAATMQQLAVRYPQLALTRSVQLFIKPARASVPEGGKQLYVWTFVVDSHFGKARAKGGFTARQLSANTAKKLTDVIAQLLEKQ